MHTQRLTTLEGWEDEVFDETWNDQPETNPTSRPTGNTAKFLTRNILCDLLLMAVL